MLVNPGDNVVVEKPTYSGALAVVSYSFSLCLSDIDIITIKFCGMK